MKKSKYAICIIFLLFFIVNIFAADVILEKGSLKILLHEYSGSFSLFIKNSKSGKFIPIIDSSNESATSGFYIKIGSKIVKLERFNGVKISADSTSNGGKLSYTVNNEIVVDINFSLFESEKNKGVD